MPAIPGLRGGLWGEEKEGVLDLKIDRRPEGEGRHRKEGERMLKNRPAFAFLRLPELLEPWGCHDN